MKKIFCDICGEEITNPNERWKYELKSNEGNSRVSYNKTLEDVCEKCTTIIHCCVSMMCECDWEPDFHESLNSDSLWKSEAAAYKLEDIKWFMFDDESKEIKNENGFSHGLQFMTWAGDGQCFIVKDADGTEYRIRVSKEME